MGVGKVTRVTLAVATMMSLAGPPGAHADMLPVAACQGTAPAATSCGTGEHRIAHDTGELTNQYWWGPAVYGQYRGRLRMIVNGSQGAHMDIYCDYTGDAATDMATEFGLAPSACTPLALTQPKPNESFVQTCISYDVDTFTLGGTGPWVCALTHT